MSSSKQSSTSPMSSKKRKGSAGDVPPIGGAYPPYPQHYGQPYGPPQNHHGGPPPPGYGGYPQHHQQQHFPQSSGGKWQNQHSGPPPQQQGGPPPYGSSQPWSSQSAPPPPQGQQIFRQPSSSQSKSVATPDRPGNGGTPTWPNAGGYRSSVPPVSQPPPRHSSPARPGGTPTGNGPSNPSGGPGWRHQPWQQQQPGPPPPQAYAHGRGHPPPPNMWSPSPHGGSGMQWSGNGVSPQRASPTGSRSSRGMPHGASPMSGIDSEQPFCQPLGEDEDMMGMGGKRDKDDGDGKDKGRGSYRCGKCGVPKKGHICPYQPKLKRRPDEPPPEMRSASTQVEMDEFLVLRRLNLEIQGFPESYTTEPFDNVGSEPHMSPSSSAIGQSPMNGGGGAGMGRGMMGGSGSPMSSAMGVGPGPGPMQGYQGSSAGTPMSMGPGSKPRQYPNGRQDSSVRGEGDSSSSRMTDAR